jgi:hypothetical protein
MGTMSDPSEFCVFREHRTPSGEVVPLLGAAPPPKGERLRVLLTLEFLPGSGVPADARLRMALKLLWRRFRAKNLQCLDLSAEDQAAAPDKTGGAGGEGTE